MALLYAYNFDEASGDILDASGNGRTTTLGGSLARTGSGAGHADKGMSQSTIAGDSNGPSISGLQTAQFTVMAWVKRSSNSQDGWIAEIKGSGSGDRGILFLSGNVQARARNSGGTVANVSTAQPTAGTWYHVAASYSTTDAKVHLFINGSEIGTGTALTGPLKTTSTGSHLMDGVGSETIIDDVRYYDTALDAAAVTALMNTPVSSGATDLAPAGATQAQSADSVTLTQAHTLTAHDATSTQAAGNSTLTQLHQLAVAPAAQAQTAETPALTQQHVLTVAAASQAQVVEEVALAIGTTLEVQNAVHAQAAEQPSLAQLHDLVVAEAAHALTSDQVSLTQDHGLVVQGATQQQTATTPTLFIVPDDGYTEAILTVANSPSSGLIAWHPQPDLAPSNAPSSQLEVSHGL